MVIQVYISSISSSYGNQNNYSCWMTEKDLLQGKGESENRERSYSTLLKIVCNTSLSAFGFGFINGNFNSIDFDDIVEIFEL